MTAPDFDQMINRHLTRAHRLRAVEQIIREDPGIVPELLEILSAPDQPTANSPQRIDARTQAAKVVAFFEAQHNNLANVREIAKATGMTRASVNALLRKSHQRDLFFRTDVGPKCTLWRLKTDEDLGNEADVDDPDLVAETEDLLGDPDD